ncbi:flagellar basal body P-ring formation chaperone FlgA [Undibacterium curvum]|uniref:Flagella basal body P-ring formation protein FlgA n=1 Tax=Undibacterium curvum TaxID=2762294 RepID=A0ABR7A7L4_9BURK|nr:flagellar basal body P-ring formation chaperone FlgA [Undibacterium curvum]MBC3932857.1 flagellar basal body P-ring formation protein FlgA [Undibacterium curvum]
MDTLFLRPILLAISCSALLSLPADAQMQAQLQTQGAETPSSQSHAELKKVAVNFLQQTASNQPGEVKISVNEADSRLNLAACQDMAAFLPPGSKPWGKISVGIRCNAPKTWQIYLQAQVQVTSDYYVAAKSLQIGQVLNLDDLSKVRGEVSSLPAGIIMTPEQAIGKSLSMSLASGSLLRMDILKSPSVVQQGQTVRIVSQGPGFQVATEGQSLSNSADGQTARARTNSGQTVSGIARTGGIIEINY